MFSSKPISPRSILLVVIVVLGLPYLVDVAFYGDLTPTHFAQEVVDESIQNDDEGYLVFLLPAQNIPLGRKILLQHPVRTLSDVPLDTSLPHDYLLFGSLISLPPPRV